MHIPIDGRGGHPLPIYLTVEDAALVCSLSVQTFIDRVLTQFVIPAHEVEGDWYVEYRGIARVIEHLADRDRERRRGL